jgi:hypothetical protein
MPRLLVAASLLALLAGCSTLDALNPFASSSGPKMADLQPIEASSADARVLWAEEIGKSERLHSASGGGRVDGLCGGQGWHDRSPRRRPAGLENQRRTAALGRSGRRWRTARRGHRQGRCIGVFDRRRQRVVESQSQQRGRCAAGGELANLVVVRSVDHRLAAYDSPRRQAQVDLSTPEHAAVPARDGCAR